MILYIIHYLQGPNHPRIWVQQCTAVEIDYKIGPQPWWSTISERFLFTGFFKLPNPFFDSDRESRVRQKHLGPIIIFPMKIPTNWRIGIPIWRYPQFNPSILAEERGRCTPASLSLTGSVAISSPSTVLPMGQERPLMQGTHCPSISSGSVSAPSERSIGFTLATNTI